jgi:putative ABC transport system permease protein
MSFALLMALREMRSSWLRLLFFFTCISIGVGSIISLRSIVQNIRSAILLKARSLVAADIEISSSQPLSGRARSAIENYRKSPISGAQLARTETVELMTMARSLDPMALPKRVELKGVQSLFPLYGSIKLSGGAPYSHELLKDNGALVGPGLLEQLGLKVGDKIKMGNLEFTIRGVLEEEPGQMPTAFRLGPRVLIDYDAAFNTGLITFGSLARYRILIRAPEREVQGLTDRLKRDLKGEPIRVRSFRQSEERIDEQLTRTENYLSLIGLVILMLGGIGILSVTRVFVEQKIKTIAILKCLGGRNGHVIATYLVQAMALGVMGSLAGLLLAAIVIKLVSAHLVAWVPYEVRYGLTGAASLTGIGAGMLISFLFSLLPLLEIRNIKPNLLLRNGERNARRLDLIRLLATLALLAGLIAIAAWQAGSIKVGIYLLGGVAAAALALYAVSALLIWSLSRLRHLPRFPLRQGINGLYRPGNQTRLVLMAVGLGCLLVVTVKSVETGLTRELVLDSAPDAPDMIFIGIQKEQASGVAEIINRASGEKVKLVPILTARLVAIEGKEIDPEKIENSAESGRLGRTYAVTYRDQLEEGETLVAGKLWEGAGPEVSLEERLSQSLGLKVDSSLTVDIFGQKITARVTSIRRVQLRRSRSPFGMVFRPDLLQDAPQVLTAAIKGPADPTARAQLQKSIVDAYPNVSAIEVLDVLKKIRALIEDILLGVTFAGGFVFLSGILILMGSIAMTKFHRIYEAAILKTLGAKRRQVILSFAIEYGILGLLAGAFGSALAAALSRALSKEVLGLEWSFSPLLGISGAMATALLVTAIGALSSLDVTLKKPLSVLRAE